MIHPKYLRNDCSSSISNQCMSFLYKKWLIMFKAKFYNRIITANINGLCYSICIDYYLVLERKNLLVLTI